MNILYLSHRLSYPPQNGGHMRSLNLLRVLVRHGNVTVLNQARSAAEAKALATFPGLAAYRAVRLDGAAKASARPKQRVMNLLQLQPWDASEFVSDVFAAQLTAAQPDHYDVIFLEYTFFLDYFARTSAWSHLLPRIVIDIDDLLVRAREQQVRELPVGYRRMRLAIDAWLLKRWHRAMRRVGAVVVASVIDQDYMVSNRLADRVWVVPNTVEVPAMAPPINAGHEPELLFVGGFAYRPNEDGIRYFCKEILPIIQVSIPRVQLRIVGHGARERLAELSGVPGVVLEGAVPSLGSFYQRAAVAIAPLLFGTGTRIKILEAMAHGTPVVSTSIGAEGLEFVNGEHLLIADEPAAFARHCVMLLQQPERRQAMARRAYEAVKRQYAVTVLDGCLGDVLRAVQPPQVAAKRSAVVAVPL